MWGNTSRLAAVLALLGQAFAHEAASTQAVPFVRRDSAGLQIAESLAPALPGGAPSLGPRPLITIGKAFGGGPDSFGKITALCLLPGGRIVVGDDHVGELKVFGVDGRLLAVVGAKGEGPGEFSAVGGIQALPGDSLLAYDPRLRRVTVFTPSLDVAYTLSLNSGDVPGIGSVFRLPTGEYLGTTGVLVGPSGPEGYVDLPIDVRRFDPANRTWVKLAQVPGRQVFRNERGALVNAPVLRRGAVAFSADFVFVGNGRDWTIAGYSPDGRTRRSIRRLGVDLSLAKDRYEAAARAVLARFDEPRIANRWQAAFARIPRPDTHPAYDDVVVADDSSLWVQQFALPGEPAAPWSVFDSTGRYVGDAVRPADFKLMDVRDGLAVGVWKDSLDVEYVQVYRVSMP